MNDPINLRDFILWCRATGIAWSELTWGDVKLVGGDLYLEGPGGEVLPALVAAVREHIGD